MSRAARCCLLTALGVATASHARAQEPTPEAEPVETTVLIQAPPPKDTAGQTQVKGEDAARVAGAQGDAGKVLQSLPSVARPAFGGGSIVVWGAAPSDTRVFVDGVEVPALYHVGGVRSVVPSSLVRSVEILPGGFGVEYGRALGGIVRVDTLTLPDQGVHGTLSVDVLDAAANLQVAVNDRLRVGIAARYSYVDRILAAIAGPEIGDYYPLPRYHDGQLKVSLGVGPGQDLTMVASHAGDEIERVVPSDDPSARKSESVFNLTERVSLRYRSSTQDGKVTTVLPFFGYDLERRQADFGGDDTLLDMATVRYGLRAEHRRPVLRPPPGASRWYPTLVLAVGLDGQGTRSRILREGSLTVPPREGDVYVFGRPPGEEFARDSWAPHIVDLAPYAALDVQIGDLRLTPGLRLNGTVIDVDRETPRVGRTPSVGGTRFEPTLDPRLSAQLRAGERLSFTASTGLYHQPPDARDLSVVFGTPALGVSESFHTTLGQSASLTETLSVDAVGFYKSMTQLAARTRSASPPAARALTELGRGEAYGVNLLLRQRPIAGFSGWISYSLSRSDRWIGDDGARRLFDFDQTHVLAVVANQTIAGFHFGLRFRIGSGMPRTPVVGAYFNAKDDRYEPVFGPQNSERLPLFYQLDLRAEKVFELGRVKLAVFADVQNVTNAANAEEVSYRYDFGDKDYVTGLPVLGVLGASVSL